jgi:hypothetical protein
MPGKDSATATSEPCWFDKLCDSYVYLGITGTTSVILMNLIFAFAMREFMANTMKTGIHIEAWQNDWWNQLTWQGYLGLGMIGIFSGLLSVLAAIIGPFLPFVLAGMAILVGIGHIIMYLMISIIPTLVK